MHWDKVNGRWILREEVEQGELAQVQKVEEEVRITWMIETLVTGYECTGRQRMPCERLIREEEVKGRGGREEGWISWWRWKRRTETLDTGSECMETEWMVGGYNGDDMWILREGRGGAGSLGSGGGRKGELVCTNGRG